jgi:hypothetical protein
MKQELSRQQSTQLREVSRQGIQVALHLSNPSQDLEQRVEAWIVEHHHPEIEVALSKLYEMVPSPPSMLSAPSGVAPESLLRSP